MSSLAQLLHGESFDIIVIGNNLGAGISRAAIIPSQLKGRVIITYSTRIAPESLKRYGELGIVNYFRRAELLTAMITLMQAPVD